MDIYKSNNIQQNKKRIYIKNKNINKNKKLFN